LKKTGHKVIHIGNRIRDAKIRDEKIYLILDDFGLGLIEKTSF